MTTATPFEPRLDILPAPQRRMWDELGDIPEEFILYGGTGLALHLGHRTSLDFDFFGDRGFDPDELVEAVPFLADAETVRRRDNILTVRLERGGPVLASFFGVPGIGRVREPAVAENGVKVAAKLDLAGMKASVVQKRPSAKDYIDLDALLRAGVTLPEALAAGRVIYGAAFASQITLKALTYFEDGDLPALPAEVRERLREAVAAANSTDLPDLAPVSPRSTP